VTGHQRLQDAAAWPWVEQVEARELDAAVPPLVVITSLAIGADQLVARLGAERGAEVHAVLPFAGIERTLPPEDLSEFCQLVNNASVEILQTPGTDEDAYLAAGRRVAELSDVMIAVWDGKPAKGKGGTADIVAYAVASGVPSTSATVAGDRRFSQCFSQESNDPFRQCGSSRERETFALCARTSDCSLSSFLPTASQPSGAMFHTKTVREERPAADLGRAGGGKLGLFCKKSVVEHDRRGTKSRRVFDVPRVCVAHLELPGR
jgi:hypothetical protein